MCKIFINGCLSFRYADKVSIGDDVLVQRNGTLIPDKVIGLSNFKMQGKYSTCNNFVILYEFFYYKKDKLISKKQPSFLVDIQKFFGITFSFYI